MQPFRIRLDAREWFRDLREKEKAFKVDFDSFYFCFIAGITERRKLSVPHEDTAELVDYFPDRYNSRGKLLVALFLTRELKELGVSLSERRDVHTAVARLISPDSRNFLSEEGVREFNKYAHGGFEVLLDWFDDRPRALPTFVRAFKQKVNQTLSDSVLVDV